MKTEYAYTNENIFCRRVANHDGWLGAGCLGYRSGLCYEKGMLNERDIEMRRFRLACVETEKHLILYFDLVLDTLRTMCGEVRPEKNQVSRIVVVGCQRFR